MTPEPAAAPPLAPDARGEVEQWYLLHGQDLLAEVGRWLRRRTMHLASRSEVAQSVWRSLIEHHRDEITEGGPWKLLAETARRHCERYNRRETRHPSPSLDAPSGHDPADFAGLSTEAAAVLRETARLFLTLDPDVARDATSLLARAPGGLGLVELLTPLERLVLAHKLARRTRPEIAAEVGVSEKEVDAHWRSIQEQAARLAADA